MANKNTDNSSMPIGKKRNNNDVQRVPENIGNDRKNPYVSQINERKASDIPQQNQEPPKEPPREPANPENTDDSMPQKMSDEEILKLPLRNIKVGEKSFCGYYDEERLEVHLADKDGNLIGKVGRLRKKLPPLNAEKPEADTPSPDDKPNNDYPYGYSDEHDDAANDTIANKLMKVKEKRYRLNQKKKPDAQDEITQFKKKKIIMFAGIVIAGITIIAVCYNYLFRSAFNQDDTTPQTEATEAPSPTSTPSISEGEMTVIELNTDVIAGDEITEDMLVMATIDSQAYNQIAITGKDLYRWEQRDNIIGMYATEYISQGHYITTDSLSKIVRDANNPWILNNSQTAYTDIPVNLTSLSSSDLLIGKKVKIDFEVEVSQQGSMDSVESDTDGVDVQSGQKTVTINSYTINNAVIADMFTEDNRSLFNIYSALLSVPEGNQEFYLNNICSKNPEYLSEIEPVKIRIYFDKTYADALSTAVSTKKSITVTAGSDADTATTEKKAFYDGELSLKASFENLAENMEENAITVKKGDSEQ